MTPISPGEYTHPDVLTTGVAEGWADAETDPARIDWAERQARAAIPFTVTGGRPVNPCEVTGRRGRNEMGLWGETPCADALVTLTLYKGALRWLLMVERGDGYGWALPGGRVEDGEAGTQAALRELGEETGLSLDSLDVTRVLPARYVPDPRCSDEAWAVTIPVHFSLGPTSLEGTALPAVAGGDDARRAAWLPARTYAELAAQLARLYDGKVFAAHQDMLREFLDDLGTPSAGGGALASLRAASEPADVREAGRKLETLDDLPSDQPGAILAAGLAAITHALLAIRETVADNGDNLAGILDAGLAGISDEASGVAVAVAGAAESIEGASWRGLLRRLASRAFAALRPPAGARPAVVCLCGSTRFYDEFQQAAYDLTMSGVIVLSVGFYPHATGRHGHGEGVGHDSAEKAALDELHKRKIDLADWVYVINPGGYIGESTRSEIAYARVRGKPVCYLTSPGLKA